MTEAGGYVCLRFPVELSYDLGYLGYFLYENQRYTNIKQNQLCTLTRRQNATISEGFAKKEPEMTALGVDIASLWLKSPFV